MKPVYLLLGLSIIALLMVGCSSSEQPVPSVPTHDLEATVEAIVEAKLVEATVEAMVEDKLASLLSPTPTSTPTLLAKEYSAPIPEFEKNLRSTPIPTPTSTLTPTPTPTPTPALPSFIAKPTPRPTWVDDSVTWGADGCKTRYDCETKGYYHYEIGEYTKAMTFYDEAIRQWPYIVSNSYYMNGLMSYELGDYGKSIEYLTCLSLNYCPDDVKKSFYKGLAYYATSQHEKALSAFDKAIELDPENTKALEERERTLSQIKGSNNLVKDVKETSVEPVKQKDSFKWIFPGWTTLSHFHGMNQDQTNTKVYQATEGGLQIEYKQFGEIGLKGGEGLTLIRDGVYPMFEIIPAYVAGDKPEMNLYYLMGLAFDMEQTYQVHDGTVAMRDEIYADYNASRLPIYGDFSFPPQALFTKKQIKTIDDLQGVKVRINSTLGAAGLRGIGMEPHIITWSGLYSALQRGAVDAAVTELIAGVNYGLGEVTSYVTIIPQGGGLMDTVFNLDALASLPTDYREVLKDAGVFSSNNTKAQLGSENYGDAPAQIAFDGGLSYWKMDDALTKDLKSTLAFHMDDWASQNGPNTRKWLYKALEILGR